ncbi:MAG: FtsW/RodA/SpoVE family cell cycle protein [Butyricicoccaceae bacterium]
MKKPLRYIGRYIRHTDLLLLILALISSLFGLVLICSATATMEEGSARYLTVQSIAIVLGIFGFIICSLIDLERFAPAWRIVLIVNIVFQLSLIPFGYASGGNQSWLRFGGIGVQPAEVGKLLFIFTFAKHVNLMRYKLNRWRSIAILLLHCAIIMAAIILPSRDVGMSLPYLFICIIMMFAGGLSLKWFAGGAILGCAAVPLLWSMLSDTQRDRILVLIDPSVSPATYWQQEQSIIAIGAGKLRGAGFMQGSQTQYNMLPEKHTDFILGVAGEEWGFLGAMFILLLLSFIILRIFWVSYRTESSFLSLVGTGIGSMFLFQTFENFFMCLGIGPVMGLTLPFFSYGGSSIVTMYIALGLVAGIKMRNSLHRARLKSPAAAIELPSLPQESDLPDPPQNDFPVDTPEPENAPSESDPPDAPTDDTAEPTEHTNN